MSTTNGHHIGRPDRGSTRPLLARRVGIALICVSLTALAACGGSGGNGGGSTATPSSVIEESKAAVTKNQEGLDRALPTSAPKPVAGQNIWLISCTQAGEGCSAPAAGAKEAADVVGWDLTVVDGKGRPDVYDSSIRSAIADNADGIILDVVDCVAAKSALQAAKEAGVKTYAFYAFDCNDPILDTPGEPLFDAEMTYGTGEGFNTYIEFIENVYARAMADYLIAKTDGKAKILQFADSDLQIGRHITEGFEARIKECTGCEIVKKVPFTIEELVAGKLGAKAEAALTQNPQADALMVPYDAALIGGIAQAVVTSGRNDDILVVGGEGLTPNVGFVKDNKGQDAFMGASARWAGWASIDGMNRLLQGEGQVDPGLGIQTLETGGPVPTQTTFYDGNIDQDGNPKQDYVANYKKIWNVS